MKPMISVCNRIKKDLLGIKLVNKCLMMLKALQSVKD